MQSVSFVRPPCAQAKEFGAAEVWMNERLMRAAPESCAQFLAAFEDEGPESPEGPQLTLVWKYEGDFTLYDVMQKKVRKVPGCGQG